MTTLKIINSLSPWNYPMLDKFTDERKNTTTLWTKGPDELSTFAKNRLNKEYKTIKTFGPSDIEYKYNSVGYRSDEFDKKDIDILYAGCSFTEGEGLPLDCIWTKQLNSIIDTEFNISLGYHCVAKGGLSCSGVARRIYGAFNELQLKPKVLFVLFPSIFRSELCSTNFSNQIGMIDYVPNYMPIPNNVEEKHFFKMYEDTIRVSNSLNEFFKNVLLIDALCKANGTQFLFSTWQGAIMVEELPSENMDYLPNEYYMGEDKTYLDIKKLIINHIPNTVKDRFLGVDFMKEHMVEDLKFDQVIARDYMHPGPNPHWQFANEMFDFSKPILKSIYEKN